MLFKHSVPILYSTDVTRSLHYYTEVLGFDNKWEWDQPPTFGGVSKNAVEIFFCKECQGNPGTWLSIFVDNVDEFYEQVKAKGATILSAPQTMEWGVREMVIEDPDGHKIRFGQNASVSGSKHNAETLPPSVRIIPRIPTAKETHRLVAVVGWTSVGNEEEQQRELSGIAAAAVAEDMISGETIGCVYLLSDYPGFYYVKNLMVHPAWQCKRIGTALMQELIQWLENNAPDKSAVYLHTGENLAYFYKQLGFLPVFGMYRQTRRNEKNI